MEYSNSAEGVHLLDNDNELSRIRNIDPLKAHRDYLQLVGLITGITMIFLAIVVVFVFWWVRYRKLRAERRFKHKYFRDSVYGATVEPVIVADRRFNFQKAAKNLYSFVDTEITTLADRSRKMRLGGSMKAKVVLAKIPLIADYEDDAAENKGINVGKTMQNQEITNFS